MSVRATVTYTWSRETGDDEVLEVELHCDAGYSPDVATDLASRARVTLAETIADVWPQPAET